MLATPVPVVGSSLTDAETNVAKDGVTLPITVLSIVVLFIGILDPESSINPIVLLSILKIILKFASSSRFELDSIAGVPLLSRFISST